MDVMGAPTVVCVWFPPFAPREPIFLLNSKEFSLAA